MRSHAKYGQHQCQSGVTLIELMIVLAVIATLASLATVSYQSYKLTSQNHTAENDILTIAAAIERYHIANHAWPSKLADVHYENKLDPWGNNYIYAQIPELFGNINIQGTFIRQDANLKPINTFYDLYSKGADGESKNNISVPVSQDDVIRARDGAFIGLAKDY